MELPELTQTAQTVFNRYGATRFKWRVRDGKAVFELFFFNEFSIPTKGKKSYAQYVISTIQTAPNTKPWSHIFQVYKKYDGTYYMNASLDYAEYFHLKHALGIENATSGERFCHSKLFDKLQKHALDVLHNWDAAKMSRVQDLPPSWRKRNVEEADAIYFVGWYQNPEGKHPRESNLEKTRLWIGEQFYHLCKEKRISSCWSANPAAETYLPTTISELQIFP